jgi:hypothetical protein
MTRAPSFACDMAIGHEEAVKVLDAPDAGWSARSLQRTRGANWQAARGTRIHHDDQ